MPHNMGDPILDRTSTTIQDLVVTRGIPYAPINKESGDVLHTTDGSLPSAGESGPRFHRRLLVPGCSGHSSLPGREAKSRTHFSRFHQTLSHAFPFIMVKSRDGSRVIDVVSWNVLV
jgi:hypothetical protein